MTVIVVNCYKPAGFVANQFHKTSVNTDVIVTCEEPTNDNIFRNIIIEHQ